MPRFTKGLMFLKRLIAALLCVMITFSGTVQASAAKITKAPAAVEAPTSGEPEAVTPSVYDSGIVFVAQRPDYDETIGTVSFTLTNNSGAAVRLVRGLTLQQNVSGLWSDVKRTVNTPESLEHDVIPAGKALTFSLILGYYRKLLPGEYRVVAEFENGVRDAVTAQFRLLDADGCLKIPAAKIATFSIDRSAERLVANTYMDTLRHELLAFRPASKPGGLKSSPYGVITWMDERGNTAKIGAYTDGARSWVSLDGGWYYVNEAGFVDRLATYST